MTSPILEALPAIHVTVIGIGAAFFSAFAIFAFQKVQEAQDHLNKVLTEVSGFSTPSNFIGGDENKLLKENGELDWDGEVKNLILHAKSLYSHIDSEEKYGIPRVKFSREPSDEDVIESCKCLCLMFHYLFVTYPFTGKSMVHIEGVTNQIEERKSQPFDLQRLQEISRRIGFLIWCWDTSNRALIELSKKCTELEKSLSEKRIIESFQLSIERMPNISEEEKNRIWSTFHKQHLTHQIDYSQVLIEYFNKILLYRDKVLPMLKEVLDSHNIYNERFKVKANTIIAIKLFVVVFIFGVLVPLLLLNLRKDIGLTWNNALDYFLLFLTTAPYFYVCWHLYKKVMKMKFQ